MTEREQYNPVQEDRSKADQVIKAIMFRLNVQTASIILVGLALVAVGLYAWTTARHNHEALCTFRSDLQDRVQQTETFLQNPEQFPQFNDPKTLALIKAQVDNQRATVHSLAGLNCD